MRYQNILLIDDDNDDQEIFLTAVKELSCSISCIALSDASKALQKLSVRAIEPDELLNYSGRAGNIRVRSITGLF